MSDAVAERVSGELRDTAAGRRRAAPAACQDLGHGERPHRRALDGRPQDHRPALHRHRLHLPVPRRALGRRSCACSWRGRKAGFIGPDLYNQLFTMHGTTMMFLFAVPVGEAFAVYLVPLMVGTRNIAFPRLNAFSYYVYLFGGLMIWVAFALNIGAGCRLVRLRAACRGPNSRPASAPISGRR